MAGLCEQTFDQVVLVNWFCLLFFEKYFRTAVILEGDWSANIASIIYIFVQTSLSAREVSWTSTFAK